MSSIRIDVRQVSALADKLTSVDSRKLGEAALGAVNESTVDFERRAIDSGILNINLQRTYVKGKTDIMLGTNPNVPAAAIITKGTPTVMGNFAPLSRRVAPGAARRAGPIAGFRSAGVRLSIKRTELLNEPQWFIMPLRAGTAAGENGFGVFMRTSDLKGQGKNDRGPGRGDAGRRRDGDYGKRHLYGPAPYQLFRTQIEKQGPQWAEDLETRAVAKLLGVIERGIA